MPHDFRTPPDPPRTPGADWCVLDDTYEAVWHRIPQTTAVKLAQQMNAREGWIRYVARPMGTAPAGAAPQTYTRAEIVNGTGWPAGARFQLVEEKE